MVYSDLDPEILSDIFQTKESKTLTFQMWPHQASSSQDDVSIIAGAPVLSDLESSFFHKTSSSDAR